MTNGPASSIVATYLPDDESLGQMAMGAAIPGLNTFTHPETGSLLSCSANTPVMVYVMRLGVSVMFRRSLRLIS